MSKYVVGQEYDRTVLHAAAKAAGLDPGIAYRGITVVGEDLCIFWNPFKKLYANAWIDMPREFTYSGEGTLGHQVEKGGNLRLMQHGEAGAPVLLFVKVARSGSRWLHMGEYQVTGHEWGTSKDDEGNWRRDLRFTFAALEQPAHDVTTKVPTLPRAAPPVPPTEAALWAALEKDRAAGSGGRRRRGTRTHRDKRLSDPLKTAYVVQRAIDFGGTCELCGVEPGWVGDDGRPHFQAHHINPDIDLVDWISALCGTCHDRMHHATDRATTAVQLRSKIRERQEELGRPITTSEAVLG
ncbi:hypothetical protein [Modestobacter excelsi]|uniref:hypothetical protein n=1 Tax=Modestobacter excelsi TaxID=2213161 RepID=UPI00110CA789|nr:hypothetical protein [Modestobacter excelsi]